MAAGVVYAQLKRIENAMPNVNCLQYATRGDNNVQIPAGTWDTAGWKDYLAQPVTGPNFPCARNWATLALAVRKLNLTTTGWKVPAITGVVKTATIIRADGLALVRHLANNNALNFTMCTSTAGAIPAANGTIVLGTYNSNGGPHYFTWGGAGWMGVANAADTIARTVTITGNSVFTQTILSGNKSGMIQGWFA